MTPETLTIDGITYNVVRAVTPEDQEAVGHKNLAVHMVRHSIRRYVYLQRPRGKAIYEAVQWENGRLSSPTTIP